MKKDVKCLLSALVFAGISWGGYGIASAAGEAVYELNPVTVTANRYEKRDVEVPASTQIISHEQLERTGQVNLQKALAFTEGTVYQQMGPGGVGLSSMTSKIIMRGMEDGTLVLVNGTPINWRGKYNLEDLPIANIDRVEIVRGGGSILYGSQATGGVINVITKDKPSNEVHAGLGNYGQQNYGTTVAADKVSVSYNYNKWGDVGIVSDYNGKGNHFKGSEKNDFLITYKASDNVNFLYNHDDSWNRWAYTFVYGKPALVGKEQYNRLYSRTKDFVQMNFKDGQGLSGHAFYLRDTQSGEGKEFLGSRGGKPDRNRTDTKDTMSSFGYDVQKVWEQKNQKWLLGTSLIRETWKSQNFVKIEEYNKKDKFVPGDVYKRYARNVFSIFGQWDKALNEKNQLTVSARETWTTGADEGKNYDNFSGQIQYTHKIDKDQSVYASVGQSFVMPSFSNMYSTGGSNRIIGDPNLKPQKGMHYEAGWKKEDGKALYKVALFSSRIKDDLSFIKDTKYPGHEGQEVWVLSNADTKNKGIEASVTVNENNGLSWHYGISYSDPYKKNSSSSTAVKKPYWDRMYGRWQMNGGLTYQKDKWTASLNGTYLCARVMTPSSTHSYPTKPYFLTSMNVQYAPSATDTISLSIDNLLDRKDNLSHTSSYYYSTPINYMVSYSHKF